VATLVPEEVWFAAPAAGRAVTVSLCLIVKNEEANLAACLGPAAGLAAEIVVVDTGSTDCTKAIAAAFGARVFDFPWVDSFAAARNECLKHATSDYIFWLDADDRIEPDQVEKFRALFASLKDENAAYTLKCVCDGAPGAGPTVVDHIRVFRNRPDIRWEHRVHEQILPAIRRSGGQVRWADAAVRHVGYRDPALRQRKLERDLRLLEIERVELNNHPFTLFNLGSVYQEMGRYAEAVPVLKLSLAKSHPKDSIVRKLYSLLAHCLRGLGDRQEALAACAGGLGHYADDAELLFLSAVLRDESGDSAGAEAALTRLLTSRPAAHFASVAAGLRGYKARCKLAEVLLRQGRAAEAEGQWRLALAEEPRSAAGWLGLGQLLLTQRRYEEALDAAGRLEALRGAEGDGTGLRARVLMSRGEFAAARELLGRLIGAAPTWTYPRVLLSHALLQEGMDPNATERALLDVLEMDPDNAEVKNNLGVLRRQRAAAPDQVFVSDVLPSATVCPPGTAALISSGTRAMRISIIIATRLQSQLHAGPHAGPDALWLDRALRSVRRQTAAATLSVEVVAGLDPGVVLPVRFSDLVAANAARAGQSAALNAATAAAGGDVIAFLEDDDYWEPKRLEYGLWWLEKHDLVTCNQREVDADGSFVGINDYPTPSGWLMRAETWRRVGPFDETFTFPDSEWLGRANAARLRRVHLVEAVAPVRPGILSVARFSAVANTAERDPLVLRTVNPTGVVGTAQSQESARLKHEADTRRLVEKYGGVPW
jgi:glycosyltransferase involved in cell wall biosynthesis